MPTSLVYQKRTQRENTRTDDSGGKKDGTASASARLGNELSGYSGTTGEGRRPHVCFRWNQGEDGVVNWDWD